MNCYLFNCVISFITLLRYLGITLYRYLVITLYRHFLIAPPPYDSGLNAIVARCSALRSAMS